MALSTISALNSANATVSVAAFADLAGNLSTSQTLDNAQQTYRASASFTPQATAGVTVITVTGSGTKTVRIKRILLGGSATALSSTLFGIQRTSVLGAGGTLVAPTVAKLDTGSAAATAVVNHWTTSLKAAGTPVGGTLSQFQLFQTTVTTPTVAWAEAQLIFPEKGFVGGQALVLRGIADIIEIQNLNAGNLAAGSILQYCIEWTEDAS